VTKRGEIGEAIVKFRADREAVHVSRAPSGAHPAPRGRGHLRRVGLDERLHRAGRLGRLDTGRATASLPAARTATVTYGRQVRPVTYPGAVPARVAEFTATDRYEDFTTAIAALDGALGLAAPGCTRILVIVSDGRYKGTQHADGQKLITRLTASGCLVIWIAPGDTANTMTGTRVVILADPAATSQAVARAVTASARTA
jgi:hypothetical protein